MDLLDVRVPCWLCAGALAGILQGIGAFAIPFCGTCFRFLHCLWCVGSSACTLAAGEEPFLDREASRKVQREPGKWHVKPARACESHRAAGSKMEGAGLPG